MTICRIESNLLRYTAPEIWPSGAIRPLLAENASGLFRGIIFESRDRTVQNVNYLHLTRNEEYFELTHKFECVHFRFKDNKTNQEEYTQEDFPTIFTVEGILLGKIILLPDGTVKETSGSFSGEFIHSGNDTGKQFVGDIKINFINCGSGVLADIDLLKPETISTDETDMSENLWNKFKTSFEEGLSKCLCGYDYGLRLMTADLYSELKILINSGMWTGLDTHQLRILSRRSARDADQMGLI